MEKITDKYVVNVLMLYSGVDLGERKYMHFDEAISYIKNEPLDATEDMKLKRIELLIDMRNDNTLRGQFDTKEESIKFLENIHLAL